MTLQARLQKVTQGLSPLQRAVLTLRALKEGREPDSDLRRIDDESQRRAFNRYVALLWVSNHHLGAITSITAYRVDLVEDARSYFDLFNEAASLLEEAEGIKKTRGFKNWRRRKQLTAPELLRSLALECREDGVRNLLHLWKEASAQQIVQDELAEDFEGEDPLLAENRDRMDDTRARLLAAADGLGARNLLVEGDDEFVGVFQTTVNEAFRQLEMTEPFQ
jgi:hypothetical protein